MHLTQCSISDFTHTFSPSEQGVFTHKHTYIRCQLLWSLTLVMMSGSPCSSPPFNVNPQGAPPLNWTWMWWKETSCSTVSILLLPLRVSVIPLVFFVLLSVLLLRLAAPVAVTLLLHHRCNINEERMDWLRKKDGGRECKRGRAESFHAGLKVSNNYSEMSLSISG